MNDLIFEWIGYSASLFIVISFIVNKLTVVRIINMIGCICFVIYGAYFEYWPVVLPNALVVLVQLYYLIFKNNQNVKA